MLPSALRALAEELVVYDDRSPERVTIYGAGVGVSRGLSRRDAIATRVALHVAIRRFVSAALGCDEMAVDAMAARLVVMVPADESSRHDVRVCGSELVGAEEPAAAESRALSMRAVLVSELQRALAGDEPPVTVRRSVPASMEAR